MIFSLSKEHLKEYYPLYRNRLWFKIKFNIKLNKSCKQFVKNNIDLSFIPRAKSLELKQLTKISWNLISFKIWLLVYLCVCIYVYFIKRSFETITIYASLSKKKSIIHNFRTLQKTLWFIGNPQCRALTCGDLTPERLPYTLTLPWVKKKLRISIFRFGGCCVVTF